MQWCKFDGLVNLQGKQSYWYPLGFPSSPIPAQRQQSNFPCKMLKNICLSVCFTDSQSTHCGCSALTFWLSGSQRCRARPFWGWWLHLQVSFFHFISRLVTCLTGKRNSSRDRLNITYHDSVVGAVFVISFRAMQESKLLSPTSFSIFPASICCSPFRD